MRFWDLMTSRWRCGSDNGKGPWHLSLKQDFGSCFIPHYLHSGQYHDLNAYLNMAWHAMTVIAHFYWLKLYYKGLQVDSRQRTLFFLADQACFAVCGERWYCHYRKRTNPAKEETGCRTACNNSHSQDHSSWISRRHLYISVRFLCELVPELDACV